MSLGDHTKSSGFHPAFNKALENVPFSLKDITVSVLAVLLFLPVVYLLHHTIVSIRDTLTSLTGTGKKKKNT